MVRKQEKSKRRDSRRRKRTVRVDRSRPEVSPLLEAAVERARKGLLQPQPLEMTTTQAAEFLDVPRPFIIKLVKQKTLPCRLEGKRRRIPVAALQDLKDQMFQEARRAADDLASTSQALGLYHLEGPAPRTQ